MKPKYKIGDKVTIKSWKEIVNQYMDNMGYIDVHAGFEDEMIKFCDKVVTIKSINTENNEYITYFIKEDPREYYFSEQMFKGEK